MYELCQELRIEVCAFLDNDPQKQTHEIGTVKVIAPECFPDKKRTQILLANRSGAYAGMKRQLRALGYEQIEAYQDYLMERCDQTERVLEIGPLNNPMLYGTCVEYFDVLPPEGLREKALAWGSDPDFDCYRRTSNRI